MGTCALLPLSEREPEPGLRVRLCAPWGPSAQSVHFGGRWLGCLLVHARAVGRTLLSVSPELESLRRPEAGLGANLF